MTGVRFEAISLAAVFIALLMGCASQAVEENSGEVVQMGGLKLTSSAFQHNGAIPDKYTCKGEDVNPPLAIENIPNGTKSLVLIVDDPDAPMGTWVHWVVWNIAPSTSDIAENSVPAGAVLGSNDFGRLDYGGPCPPSGTHRYFFKLYALDMMLELEEGATKGEVEQTMEGHVLAQTSLMGTYSKK